VRTAWCRTFTLSSLLALPVAAHAQEPTRVPEPPGTTSGRPVRFNALSVVFDRNLNTSNWTGRFTLDTVLVSATRIRLRQQYLSNIIQLDPANSHTGTLRSDQLGVLLGLSQPLSRSLDVRAEWSGLTYTDNKNIGLNDASFQSVTGGMRYTPFSAVSITPLAGYRWDNQAGIRDAGPSVNVEGRLDRTVFDGYEFQGIGQYHTDFVDPRKLESHTLRLQVGKEFAEGARDSLISGIARNRREFYVAGDSLIEGRLENVFSLINLLDYRMSSNVGASFLVTFNSRALDKDTRTNGAYSGPERPFGTHIDEYLLESHLQTSYLSDDGSVSGYLRFSYGERNEAHAAKLPSNPTSNQLVLFAQQNRQEKTKDNISRRSMLSGGTTLPLSLTDRLGITGSVSILRYDTPSELNVEDRDEFLAALSIATQHRLGQFLEVGIILDGTLSHLVYLLKERSANNNINRVLRLAPRTVYRPASWLATTNVFEVLANYTVYDYEQQVALVRSFSYRQFAWLDSTRVEFGSRLGLDFFLLFKLYERGLLRWDEFTEQTENSFADRTVDALLRFTPASGTLFGVGVRYFSQSRYQHTGSARTLQMFLRSVGPTCAVLWQLGPHSGLYARGWLEHRTQPDGTKRRLANVFLNILVNL